MPATDLPLLIDAARMAGRVATSFVGPAAARWDKPDDAGPVTEADLAVNDALSSTLRLARPDYGWLSEETEDDGARLTADTVFIVDPIDGTRNFVDGGGPGPFRLRLRTRHRSAQPSFICHGTKSFMRQASAWARP